MCRETGNNERIRREREKTKGNRERQELVLLKFER